MRNVLCAVSVLLLLGCSGQTVPLTNPFLSPVRVPPPATRTVLPGTAQPYYPGDPPPTGVAVGTPVPSYPPGTTYAPVQPTTPGTTYPAYPAQPSPPVVPPTSPNGWNTNPPPSTPYGVQPTGAELPLQPNFNGRGVERSFGNDRPIGVQGDSQNLRFVPQQYQTPPQEYQTPQTPPTPPATPSGDGRLVDARVPSPTAAPTRQVQIREVQPAEYLPAGTSTLASTTRSDGFRPQGGQRNTPAPRNRVGSSDAARFGHEPNYDWLRGKLEYSQSTNQWKLRYISVQTEHSATASADRYGGSVLIDNPQVLGELRSGDFVMVRGQLRTPQTDSRSFAPVYSVAVVQRQRL